MPHVLCSVTLKAHSGVVEDDVQNSFVILADAGWDPDTDADELAGPILAFYNNTQSTGTKLSNYFSSVLSRAAGGVVIKMYDIHTHLDGSPHGSPVAVVTGTLSGGLSSDNMPSEVAGVLTWRGDGWESALVEAGATRPKQRRTGRTYLGPLLYDAFSLADYTDAKLADNFRTCALDAAEDLCDGLGANAHSLEVWSRASATTHVVVAAQIDNAADTQRRRGSAPTSRLTRVVVP